MTSIAQPAPGLIATIKQRWAAAAERRTIARAEHARLSEYVHVGTMRATIFEENQITGRRGTFKGVARLLENGYGYRKVEGNCDAIEDSEAANAFRSGMSIDQIATNFKGL